MTGTLRSRSRKSSKQSTKMRSFATCSGFIAHGSLIGGQDQSSLEKREMHNYRTKDRSTDCYRKVNLCKFSRFGVFCGVPTSHRGGI